MQRKRFPPYPEKIKKFPGKKDTRRWCKGVVGREHKLTTVRWPIGTTIDWGRIGKYTSRWYIDLCSVCGKHRNLRRKEKTDDKAE